MAGLILFNKPFQVLSQFTDRAAGDDTGRTTLSAFIRAPGFRVAGRLDYDSEGLLLLTDDGQLQHLITDPERKTWKTYWVQVEGCPDETALAALRRGVELKDGPTRPAKAELMAPPADIWPRTPPIRQRRNLPTSWLELSIREGRNRQVRRMTAAVGHSTLRLIRVSIGEWSLQGLQPGQSRRLDIHMPRRSAPRAGRRQRA